MNALQRCLVVLIVNGILATFLSLANHNLSSSGVYLHQYITFIIFPLLYLRIIPAMLVVCFTMLMFEVLSPFSYGTLALIGIGASILIVIARDHIRRENEAHIGFLAAGVNLLFMLVASLAFAHQDIFNQDYWTGTLQETLLSTMVTLVAAPIVVSFLQNLFLSVGVDLGGELRDA